MKDIQTELITSSLEQLVPDEVATLGDDRTSLIVGMVGRGDESLPNLEASGALFDWVSAATLIFDLAKFIKTLLDIRKDLGSLPSPKAANELTVTLQLSDDARKFIDEKIETILKGLQDKT